MLLLELTDGTQTVFGMEYHLIPFLKVTTPPGTKVTVHGYLTIIPRAQVGSESIAHEAEGRMGYRLGAHEGERNNCFSKIQLVGKKNIETKHLSLVKDIALGFKAGAFRY